MDKESHYRLKLTLEYLLYIILLLICIAGLHRLFMPRQPMVNVDFPKIVLPEVQLQPE